MEGKEFSVSDLVAVLREEYEVDEETAKGLKYQDINAWDSIGHMDLVATLEDAFDIEMNADDIIDFSSFKKGIEILAKYGIEI